MIATQDFETILTSRELPAEFLRVASSSHQGDEPNIDCILSGMAAAGLQDEVICPLMLRRNLVVPAYRDWSVRKATSIA
jgi:hypothetical protein